MLLIGENNHVTESRNPPAGPPAGRSVLPLLRGNRGPGGNGGAGGARTIKDCFKNAGVFPDGTPWDDSKVDEYFSGDTFVSYGSHKFNMFYMEGLSHKVIAEKLGIQLGSSTSILAKAKKLMSEMIKAYLEKNN